MRGFGSIGRAKPLTPPLSQWEREQTESVAIAGTAGMNARSHAVAVALSVLAAVLAGAADAADFYAGKTVSIITSGGGAYEANPVMRGVVGSPAAFFAVKAGSTAGMIWIAERMRKKHPVRAMVFMASANAAMAAVVAHNMRVQ